jgi:hypothetical protein
MRQENETSIHSVGSVTGRFAGSPLALVGDLLKPERVASLFWAAPSIALGALHMAVATQGAPVLAWLLAAGLEGADTAKSQAHESVESRGAAAREHAARKAVHTKGKERLKQAVSNAAETRTAHRASQSPHQKAA